MRKYIKCIPTIAIALALSGCLDNSAPAQSVKTVQAQKAQAAANSLSFTENAEIENIKRRVQLTSSAGLVGYIVLFNDMGQPVLYTGVKGKVTSGSKRLTKPYEKQRWDCGNYACDKELPAPSDEGTYGSSGDYIFFWTTADQYIQWNGRYVYSDKPLRLSSQPLIVEVK